MVSANYFDPDLIAQLAGVGLQAAYVADGWIAGGHLSKRFGSSVEFADHKSYSPGDDAKHIDWKLNARTDRYFLKRFEDESNRQFLFLIDQSGSMAFRGSKSPWSKWQCASTVLVSLGLICLNLGDAVGVATVTNEIEIWFEPTRNAVTIRAIIDGLESAKTIREADLSSAITELANRLRKKTCVVILSDFLDPTLNVSQSLQRLIFDGHQVFAIQVLDATELEFSITKVSEFVDLETRNKIRLDPVLIREQYQHLLHTHQQKLRTTFDEVNAMTGRCLFMTLDTSQPLAGKITQFLESVAAQQ